MPHLSETSVHNNTFDTSGELRDTLAEALSTGYRYLKSLRGGNVVVDETARKSLAEAASKLLTLATAPKEYLDLLAGNNQVLIALRWLVRLSVLDHVPVEGSIAYSELASAANVPESQLKSVARMAMTSGFLSEREPGYVSHSPFSSLLAKDKSFMDWARFLTDYSVPAAYRFPEATKRWGETDKKDETSFSLAMNKQMPFFDYVREEPGMASMFSSYMRNVAATDGVGFHHLLAGFAWDTLPAGALIVDVGGSRGQASIALAKRYPSLNFLIQDLPETIAGADEALRVEHADVADRIKFMSRDFFGPQTIVDGDIYLLRMIIHDWPDVEALKILTQLKTGLKKPGARIIIMDTVLPEAGSIPALEERKLRVRDLTMVQVFNAKEREYEAWNQLLGKAGLRIINSEHPAGSVMSLLEVGLLEEPSPAPVLNGHQSTALNGHAEPAHATASPNGTHTSTDASPKPVIIIGAGIGGLCLAQSLKKAGIPFAVFERDPVLDHRPQGYRLKIEADGTQALKACLSDRVYERFEQSCALTTVGQTDYNPFNGTIVRSREGTGLAAAGGLSATATVDRGVFREILMTGISEHVTFGKDVTTYEIVDAEQTVTVRFKDGTSVQGRFLVGADGVRSPVRKTMLPSSKYVDTGAMCIYGKTPMSPELLEQFPSPGLRWMTACVDEAPTIQSILIGQSPLTLLCEPIRFPAKNREHMKLPDDYVYWVLIGRRELFAATPSEAIKMSSSENSAARAVQVSLDLTKEWHPTISSLIRLQDTRQSSPLQVVSALPNIPSWEPSRYVTLVGDAIHTMSPCGGVGANTALTDAAELAQVIVGVGKGPLSAAAIGAYEESMRKRAFRSVMRSFAGSKKMFDQRPFEDCSVADV